MSCVVKLLDNEDHGVSNMEVTVQVTGGVKTQAYRLIGQCTEYASTILTGNDCLSAAPYGVTLNGPEEWVGQRILDGDPHLSRLPVVFLQNAVQRLSGMVPLPKIRRSRIS